MLASVPLLVPLALLVLTSPPDTASTVEAESVVIQLIDEVDVAAGAAGILVALDTAEGLAVGKGAKLGTIDDREASLLVQQAKIELRIAAEKAADDIPQRLALKRLDFARAERDRLVQAAKNLPRSISKTQLTHAQWEVDQAELQEENARREIELAKLTHTLKQTELSLAQQNVAKRQIVAPINGVVVELMRRAGEWVEPGDAVLRIVRLDRLRAEGLVSVEQIGGINTGDAATVTVDVDAAKETQFAGRVVFVSPEVNPVNGRFRVWVEVDNRRGLLRPGLRAKMTISPGSPASVARSDQPTP